MALSETETAEQVTQQASVELAQYPTALVILDDTQYQDYSVKFKELREAARALDAEKKTITAPMNKSLKAVRELFKKPEYQVSIATAAIKNAMLAYTEKQAFEARQAAETVSIGPEVSVITAAPPRVDGVSIRTNIKSEVTDIEAVIKAAAGGNKLAVRVLTIDTGALHKLTQSLREDLDIPGIKVFAQKTVAG